MAKGDVTARDQALQIVSTDEQHAEDLIKAFENLPEENQKTAKQNLIQGIQERIREIDEQLTAQVNQVIHEPKFQQLEATWNGLHYLVYKTETGPRLKLKLLVVTKEELEADLKKAVDHDQSALFKKIYEEEYGTFGGHPFSMLVSGEEFGASGDDVPGQGVQPPPPTRRAGASPRLRRPGQAPGPVEGLRDPRRASASPSSATTRTPATWPSPCPGC